MTPFEAELIKRIGEETTRLRDEICAGQLTDFVAYKTACSKLESYARVLGEFSDDVRTELAKR